MRVNIDEQALNEPRIKRMAKRLGRTHFEILGRILPVWMLCYQRRSAIVDRIDVDIAADLDGFADVMVADEMAEAEEGQSIYVRGVTERIEWLTSQAQKGRKSGESRRAKTSNRTTPRTTDEQVFEENRTGVEQRFASGSTNHRTYSLAPDQALALSQAPDQLAPLATGARASDPSVGGTDHEQTSADASASDGAQRTEQGKNVRENASHALVELVSKPTDEPPAIAITTAAVLMDYVLTAQPNGRIAKLGENDRENEIENWARTLRKMHVPIKREYAAIQAAIHWAFRDASWRQIVTDAEVLRVQFNAIVAHKDRRKPHANDAVSDADLRKMLWPIEQRLNDARVEVAEACGLDEPLHEHPTSEDQRDAMARLRESGADATKHLEHVLAVAVAEARVERSIDHLGWCIFRPKAWSRKVRSNPSSASKPKPQPTGAPVAPDPAAERARAERQRVDNEAHAAQERARSAAAARDREEVRRIAQETSAAMNGRSPRAEPVDDGEDAREDAPNDAT